MDLKGSPIKQPVPYRFTLRVVLRPRKLATTIPHSSEEEEEERKIKAEKKETVRFEVEEKPVKQQSDSDDLAQSGGSFLAKRAQNITANKAMVNVPFGKMNTHSWEMTIKQCHVYQYN